MSREKKILPGFVKDLEASSTRSPPVRHLVLGQREYDERIRAAEAQARKSALEEAAQLAEEEWRELFRGSALDADLNQRMQTRAAEAIAISRRIRALIPAADGPKAPEGQPQKALELPPLPPPSDSKG